MSAVRIAPETMIPDVLAAHPGTRAVFDRYGLAGCGGARGPVESLDFFSRTHGVDLAQLLDELTAAGAADHNASSHSALLPAGGSAEPSVQNTRSVAIADVLYRRFFKAAIALTLTFGVGWGVWLLWRIAAAGSFTAISVFHVNAHGHAQIYGWVGLFIMGFAYQALGRFRHAELAHPGWANASFYLMLTGILVGTTGQIAHASRAGLIAAMAGHVLELAAVGLFVAVMAMTYRRSRSKGFAAHDGYIFAAIGWLAVQGLFGLAHLWLTMTAVTTERLVFWVATLQAPLRDMQIHGLAMMMIFGVALRLFPGVFRLPAVASGRAWTWLALLNAAVATEVGLFISYRLTGSPVAAGLMPVAWAVMLVGVVALVWPWKLWRPLPESDRSGKFVRAAFAWLVVSMVMLVLLPVHGAVSGKAFSHAYYGAIRHAVTVGFVSMMILGMGAKVVPTLNGLDTRRLGGLWAVFVLLNVGCAWRVGLQVATDFWPGAFGLVGVSGVLELAAIGLWGVGLWRIMAVGARGERIAGPGKPPPARIEPHHKVADVLAWRPDAEAVFIRFGFSEIANPVLRRTVARWVSLAGACAMTGRDVDALVAAINELATQGRGYKSN